MKALHVFFTNEDFAQLTATKNKLRMNWHNFLLEASANIEEEFKSKGSYSLKIARKALLDDLETMMKEEVKTE